MIILVVYKELGEIPRLKVPTLQNCIENGSSPNIKTTPLDDILIVKVLFHNEQFKVYPPVCHTHVVSWKRPKTNGKTWDR